VGKVVASKYRLDAELGRGGMGAVYRAFHLRVHKTFAIKLLHGEAAEHKGIASRFFLEAQAAGRIGHPGILDVYDVGETEDGTPFIVMELLRGEALSTLLRRCTGESRLGIDAACWIAMEVLDILDAAHKAGVIHRDVKPQNVFLVVGKNDEVSVKLLDFGIAKFAEKDKSSLVTKSGEIIGSPLYMAPEQAKGDLDVDARVDVWSVGAMFFEMLTGAAAHGASTPVAVLAKILTEAAPAPSTRDGRVPKDLDAIVLKALAIDRTTRYPDARAMRDALAEVRKNAGHEGKPVLPPITVAPIDSSPSLHEPGTVTSTVAVPSDRPSALSARATTADSGSMEPALEAAMTKSDGTRSRGRPVAITLAIAVLAIAAIVPWLVPGFTQRATIQPPASEPSTKTVVTPPSVGLSASAAETVAVAQPTAANAPSADRSANAATASLSASVPAPPPPVAASQPAAVVKQPACAPGEVLSLGHCCPRGLVWQSGRCERPLATSF
jgi:eukaryotic-like serine/threonine-protein kinase